MGFFAMKSNTQTIWRDFLQMPDFLPVKPPKSIDSQCWLCGGETDGIGWDLKAAIGGAFTDHPAAKASHSQTLCCACAALTSKDAFVMACEKHGHSPYFPAKDGKPPFLSNWMFNSHVFSEQAWRMPSRAEMRDVLLSPPEPPFAITLANAGKKHVIFRAPVNHSRDLFSIQFDEQTALIDRNRFAAMLQQFEAAYALGFSKDSLLTGQYNTAVCMKIGLATWRNVEEGMAECRLKHGELLKIVAFCAKKS
jgi:hypothetical protein